MKKNSTRRVKWLNRRQWRVSRAQRRHVGLRKQGRASSMLARGGTSVIPVPTFLIAERDTHRRKIQKTLSSVRSVLRRPRTRVRLDFSRTKKLFPGGTLVFLAHLHLLLEEHPGRIKARCPPRSLAGQLMRHFGIADKLGINPETSQPSDESVIHWRYRTGTFADGRDITEILDSYRQSTCATIPDGLYDVLTEALTNVRHHAYRGADSVPEEMKRWWIFSRYVAPETGQTGNLYIAVYDVGVGIQGSMRRKLTTGEYVLARTDELFGWAGWTRSRKRLDRLLLTRAIEHDRSSTGLGFRGKGLPEMREFVLETESGKLCIISGTSQYVSASAEQASICSGCGDPIIGTLILWSIPLQCEEQQCQ